MLTLSGKALAISSMLPQIMLWEHDVQYNKNMDLVKCRLYLGQYLLAGRP